jgi:hypothetical protein
MSDPVSLATLDVLTKVATPASYTDANLRSLVMCRAVNLSLEHGNTDASCFGYVTLGAAVAGPRFGDYAAGFRFGRLAYDLVDQRGLQRFKARTYVMFGNLVMPWTKHVRTGRDLVRRAFDVANAVGDLTFATLSYNNLITNLLAVGDPLVDVQREAEEGLEFAEKGRFGLVVDRFAVQLGLIRTLRGLTPVFGCFNGERFDELQFERHLSSNPMLALPECWYWIRKLQARFFAGDYVSAVEASAAAQRLLWTSPSYFETAEPHFYGALSQAASCDAALPAQYQQHVQALTAHHRQLLAWAKHGPENFANRAALVARRSLASKAGSWTPNACTKRRSAQRAKTASCTTKRSPTNWPRASTRLVGSSGSRTCICGTPATVISVGEPSGRCNNSTRCIQTSDSESRSTARRARSERLLNSSTSRR